MVIRTQTDDPSPVAPDTPGRERVLCFVDANWLGHTLRLLEVARCLSSQGTDIEFAGRGRFSRCVRARGFRFHELPGPDRLKPRRWRRVGLSWLGECRWIGRRVQTEVDLLSRRRPAAVLFDYCPTANLSAEVLGIPTVSLLNANYTSHVELGHVPFLSPLLERWLPGEGKRLLVRAATRGMVLPLNAARRGWGLPPWPDFFAALSGELNLVCDSARMTGATRLPWPCRLVGPILVCSSDVDPVPEPVLAERPVFITLGSNSYPRLMDELLGALTDAGLPVLASVPGEEIGGLAARHPRARIVGMVDNLAVMRRARCVVCHGGAGTVYQALATSCPVIAVPLNHGQQFYAWRLEALGLGRSLLRQRLRVDLEPTIRELCGDREVRLRLREERSRPGGGAARAAEIVHEYLAHVRPWAPAAGRRPASPLAGGVSTGLEIA